MEIIKSKLELEVSNLVFPVLITETRIGEYELKNGITEVCEHLKNTMKDEDKEFLLESKSSAERLQSVMDEISNMSAEDVRWVTRHIFENKFCELDEVLREEDFLGLHINGELNTHDKIEMIWQYVENEDELLIGLFHKIIESENGEALSRESIFTHNRRKAIKFAIQMLMEIEDTI